jgi:hypothetical protein
MHGRHSRRRKRHSPARADEAFGEIDDPNVKPREQIVEIGRRYSGKSRQRHVLNTLAGPPAAKQREPVEPAIGGRRRRNAPRGATVDCIMRNLFILRI